MKKLLIAGIDPGTTLGYALLDLNGKIVKTRSSKQLEMSSLILEMIKEGRVVIIGTDKGKTPKFIEKLSSKIGARVIKPQEDMSVEEKRETTKEYDFKDEHEKDALASALYAFKRIRGLLNKIDNYLKEKGKEGISNEVKQIMLSGRGLRIYEAVDMVEKPETETASRRKRIKTGKMKEEHFDYEEEKEEETEPGRPDMVRKNMNKMIKERMRNIIRIKDQKIDFLTRKARAKEEEVRKLNEEITKLQKIIEKSDKNIILTKIKNLSSEEIEKKELGKTIFVEDPNAYSEKSADRIREKVNTIISKKEMSDKLKEKFQVTFINANKLDPEEHGNIILINKEKLEKEKSKINVVKKVVEEYKQSRK
ncbi:MAG: DUF460 domain-containing protein [archaeon]